MRSTARKFLESTVALLAVGLLAVLCGAALKGFAGVAGYEPTLRECSVAAVVLGLHVAACAGCTVVLLDARIKVKARRVNVEELVRAAADAQDSLLED